MLLVRAEGERSRLSLCDLDSVFARIHADIIPSRCMLFSSKQCVCVRRMGPNSGRREADEGTG